MGINSMVAELRETYNGAQYDEEVYFAPKKRLSQVGAVLVLCGVAVMIFAILVIITLAQPDVNVSITIPSVDSLLHGWAVELRHAVTP